MSKHKSFVKKGFVIVILGILLFSSVAPFFEQTASAATPDSAWLYRKPITINHALVVGDLASFPVLIDITDMDLASKAQLDGDDIIFTAADGSPLSHEIEYYNAGHLVAWVKVPALSSSVDTTIYMYYGNAEAANQEDPSGVWDLDFMMVQHLSEPTGPLVDSTVNNNDGSPVNGVVQGATGKVDGAADFDGSNDYASVVDSDSLAGFAGGFTASFWVRLDSVSGRQTFLNKWNAGTGQRAWYVEFDSSQANKLAFFVSADGTAYSYWRAVFNPVVGDWYHISIVWQSGQQPIFYVNGQSVTTTTATARASICNNAEPLYIGRSYTTGRYFNGVLDEVCLSDSIRSSNWILTSYANQVNPSSFFTVGPEESVGEPVNSAPVISDIFPLDDATNVPLSLDAIGGMVSDPDGDAMDIYCTTNPEIGHSEGFSLPDTSFTVPVSGLSPSTTYEWTLSVTDGEAWTNRTYSFTTAASLPSGESKLLTIDHTLVAGNLANFPALVDLTDSDLASKAQPDGSDIYFTDASDSALSYEIESYIAGHLIAWVKVPSLSSSVDTTIKMHYGNPEAGNSENSAAVWDSNFMMVQHLRETSGPNYDSTANGNDGTAMNGVAQGITGKVDGAADFDGSNDYVSVVDSDSLAGFAGGFTASFWVRLDSVSGRQTFLNKWNAGTGQRAWYVEFDSSQANKLAFFVSADGTAYSYWRAVFNPVVGDWYHISIVWQSGQQPTFYVNGATVGVSSSTARASIYNNAEPLYIGRSYLTTRYFNGAIDEVSISNLARSAQWIQTCYNNQMDPTAFFGTAPVSTPPEVVNQVPVSGATGVSVTTAFAVTFSEPMDRAATEAAFSLGPVAGTFGWSSGDTVMTFTPGSTLAYETEYTATITTDAKDKENENMAAAYTSTFTTEAESEPTPPTITAHIPSADETGVAVTTTIRVTFSEAMNHAASEGAFSISPLISGSFSWSSGDTVLTFTPSTPLAVSTVYTVTVTTAAQDMQSEFMLAAYDWSFTTEPEVGPTPPTITTHTPSADESGVATTTPIRVTFSEAMNHAASESAFSINPSISGSFGWSSGDTVLTFTPSTPLTVSTVYAVTVTTAAQDMQGEFMLATYDWSFTTTNSVTAPYVTSTSPTNGATDISIMPSYIQAMFSESMDTASCENCFSINPSITGTFSWSSWGGTNRLRFVPSQPLEYDTTYTVTLSTQAMDLEDEHMLQPYVFSFTTAHYNPPYVMSTTPTSSQTGVTTTIWGINFSQPMSSTATFNAISITASPTYRNTNFSDYRMLNSSFMEFYFSPLRSFTTYTINLSTDALSAQGANLTAPYMWTFTTGDVGSPNRKWTATIPSGQGAGEASPLIADITSDLGEEIVYAGSGTVRCLNGRTGATIWNYSDSAIGWNVQAQMSDIDNDGQMEIIVPLQSPTGVLCLNTDNTQTGSAARSLYWKRTGIGGSSYTSKPLLVDPDGDGFWMVFCAPEDVRGYSTTNTYTSRIWAFNYNGQEMNNGLWGSAGGTRTATNGYNPALGSERYQWFAWRPCSGGFSMADTDNNGLFELFQNDRDMYYGDGDYGKGTICWEWNTTSQRLQLKWYQPDMLVSSHAPVLVDVTNDGVLDVVAAYMRGGLAVFNSTTGAEIRKDYNIGLPVHYQQVVYDIDRDGNPELLCADGDHPTTAAARQLIVVFDLVEWKVDATMYVGKCKFAPTVGEVTGDGIMDIIAVSDTGVYIFDGSHDPSVDQTYPVKVVDFDQPGVRRLPYQCMYAVVQDIDADGLNEIVVTSSGYRVVAYDTPGVTPGERPRSEVQYYNERRTGVAEYVPPVFYDRTAPILSDAYPSHEATNIPVGISRLQFTIEDLQSDSMNYIVTANFAVDSADLIKNNVADGTYYVDVTGTLAYHSKYTWSVSVTDGVHWNNKTYTFTTPEGTPPGSAPTQNTPLLESDGVGEYAGSTTANLICTSQGTSDANGDAVTNIYRWLRNNQPIANLIMPFDTDSLATAKDYSGYNSNAQIHGPTWTSSGVVGGAYSFDGVDDYMKISDGGAGYYNGRIYDSNLGGEGDWHELTMEMWFNMEEFSTKQSTRLLMKLPSYEIGFGSVGGSDRNTNTLTAGVWLDNPDSGDNAGPPNSDPKATEYWRLTSSALAANTWYHVALTYKDGGGTSNSYLALYINGSLAASSSSLTTRGPIKASSGEPLYIGWYDYFKGMIDEVRIYSTALSAEQIQQRYGETKDGLTGSSMLSNKETTTGEVWSCQVIPNDSHWDGTARVSNTLTITSGPQTPPVASNVRVMDAETLSTSRAWSNNTIRVIYDYFDQNDDPEVFGGTFGTQIRWYQNGTYMPAWDNLLSLSPSLTSAHYQYNCTVTPGDGQVLGIQTASTTKPLMNSPPEVTDFSPEYQLSLDHLTLNIGESETFDFTCRDRDLDAVNIQWQVGSVNATAASQSYTEYTTGSFTYTFPALGSYTVRVRITDFDPVSGAIYETTTKSWSILIR